MLQVPSLYSLTLATAGFHGGETTYAIQTKGQDEMKEYV